MDRLMRGLPPVCDVVVPDAAAVACGLVLTGLRMLPEVRTRPRVRTMKTRIAATPTAPPTFQTAEPSASQADDAHHQAGVQQNGRAAT